MTTALHQRYIDEIKRYGTFEDDWDGDGGLAAKPEDIQLAIQLLDLWPKNLPLICPMIGNKGTIGFYIDTGDYYMDIEIEKDQNVSVYVRSLIDEKQEKFFENLPIDKDLTKVLNDIVKQYDK